MAERANKLMGVDEFVAWNGEKDVRYQLRHGVPQAMSPASEAHQILVGELSGRIHAALRGRPGRALRNEAGLRSPSDQRTFHIVDIAVSCVPARAGSQEVTEPVLLVEVLSPSTADDDRRGKLPDFRLVDSVQEILLINSRVQYAEVQPAR